MLVGIKTVVKINKSCKVCATSERRTRYCGVYNISKRHPHLEHPRASSASRFDLANCFWIVRVSHRSILSYRISELAFQFGLHVLDEHTESHDNEEISVS